MLAQRQVTPSVIDLLDAKMVEEDDESNPIPGFQVVNSIYAIQPAITTASFWSRILKEVQTPSKHQHNKKQSRPPLTERQDPIASSTLEDIEKDWVNELTEDEKKTVKLLILRVIIPNLGSFESL